MPIIFRMSKTTGAVAIYEPAPGGGDPEDLNAPMHRPLHDPVAWFDLIYFHSDLNYMEVSTGPVSVTVNHPSVATIPAPPGATINFGWGSGTANHVLAAHGLGYAPLALVALGNNILWPGMPVQVQGDGGMRFATVYSDATNIRLYEFASVGTSPLAATSLNYTVIVFRNPPTTLTKTLFKVSASSGEVEMGLGKFNTLRRYLQVVPGGTPFGISYGGRTIDLANGAPRAYRPDGTYYEPVPPGTAIALARLDLFGRDWGNIFGSSMHYTGAYGGPQGNIQVQAP